MFEFITVRELYELYINDRDQLDGIEYVELQGWIRTNRNSCLLYTSPSPRD